MYKIITPILLTFSINCYSQLDSTTLYEIIDSSINISIKYDDKWRELKVQRSVSTSETHNKYTPVIHIESNPDYQSELKSTPSVVATILVIKDSNYDSNLVQNEDGYLNQIKVEMLQLYGHLQFEDETKSTKIESKEVRSLKASVNTMGYLFYQEYMTFFYNRQFITLVLLYNDEEIRKELISLIAFIE